MMWQRPSVVSVKLEKTAIYIQAWVWIPMASLGTHKRSSSLQFCLCKCLYLSEHACALEKEKDVKDRESLPLVYCSTSDVALFGAFYTVMVAQTAVSFRAAAVYSGKQNELNLQWHRSSVSRGGWRSAGTRVMHWSSWIHLEDCWGSKHTWHESTELNVNNMKDWCKYNQNLASSLFRSDIYLPWVLQTLNCILQKKQKCSTTGDRGTRLKPEMGQAPQTLDPTQSLLTVESYLTHRHESAINNVTHSKNLNTHIS